MNELTCSRCGEKTDELNETGDHDYVCIACVRDLILAKILETEMAGRWCSRCGEKTDELNETGDHDYACIACVRDLILAKILETEMASRWIN
jgi:DNA-directed RNA polymerase subunit RPC12/RpoP